MPSGVDNAVTERGSLISTSFFLSLSTSLGPRHKCVGCYSSLAIPWTDSVTALFSNCVSRQSFIVDSDPRGSVMLSIKST